MTAVDGRPATAKATGTWQLRCPFCWRLLPARESLQSGAAPGLVDHLVETHPFEATVLAALLGQWKGWTP